MVHLFYPPTHYLGLNRDEDLQPPRATEASRLRGEWKYTCLHMRQLHQVWLEPTQVSLDLRALTSQGPFPQQGWS